MVSIRTHQQLLAPLKGSRPHLINIRGRQRLITPPEGGSFRQLILAKQQTMSPRLIPENHRHLLTPLDEWSLQATDINRKPNHQLTLIMHDLIGLWDHMWCEEMLVNSDIHNSRRKVKHLLHWVKFLYNFYHFLKLCSVSK